MYKISHLFRIALLPLLRVTLFSILLIAGLIAQASLPPGTSIHLLGNGLQVLLIENQALPMVGVNVVVRTGSAYETFATSGMSHMLEHLLYNGTTTRSQKELYDATDLIGAYNNANTGEYYTNYMIVTPAENIREGMEIQADMLFNSTLPEEKYEKEKGIVLEEIARSLSNSEAQVERDLQSILFTGHALALPTLGTYATIESLQLQKVREYYAGTYIPNNMILSAVGRFDSQEMLTAIKEIYGKAKPGAVFRPVDETLITGFDSVSGPKEGTIYHRSYEGDKTILHFIYRLPRDEDESILELMGEALTEKIPQWTEEIQKEYPDISVSLTHEFHYAPYNKFLEVRLRLSDDAKVNAILELLPQKVTSLSMRWREDEIEALVARMKTEFYKSLEKPHMFGIYNAHTFSVSGIDGWLQSLDFNNYFQSAEKLRHYRLNGDPIVVIHHPQDRIRQRGSDNDGSPELFEHEESGLKLIARQNSASQLLAIHFLFKHKARLESTYGQDAARIFHDCFGQRMNSQKLQRESRGFGLSFKVNDNPYIPMDDIYLHTDFGYIRVEGLADDLDGVVKFLSGQMIQFTPTEMEFRRAVQAGREAYSSPGQNKARDRFEDLYNETIYEAIRYPADSTGLTYDKLLTFGEKYFQPGNMIVSVVSPFTPEQVNDIFSYFWETEKTTSDDELAYERSFKLPEEPFSIVEESEGAQSYLFWGYMKHIEQEDKAALKALSLLLQDKIVFEVREKQGLAYRIHAGIEVIKDVALFSINFGTRPENVDVLVPQFPGFFAKTMLDDINEKTLEKSVNMYLGRMMFRRLSSINQAYYLGRSYYFYGDMRADAEFLEELQEVTLQDVREVAEKYMEGETPISIVVQ